MRLTGAGVNRHLLLATGCLMVAISACGSTSSAPAPAKRSGVAQAAAGSDEILATVESLSKLEEQAYELKKQQVEDLIAAKLLAAEAARRGTTVEALVQQEVTAHVAPVTDSEIAAFVAANRSRIPGDPAQFTGQIRNAPRRSVRRSSTRSGRRRRWRCTSRRRPSSAPLSSPTEPPSAGT